MIIPIVLAGGDGKRFESSTHKLLADIGKYKTIDYALILANKINKTNFCITSKHINNYIKKKFPKTIRVIQKNPLGTAHALTLIKNKIDKNISVIILYGDMPLLTFSSLKPMISHYLKNNKPLLLYFKSKKKLDFAQVTLKNNTIKKIVENKNIKKNDKLKNQFKNKIYNGGVTIVNYAYLKKLLKKINFNKKYNQKLFTDIFKISFYDKNVFQGFYLKNNEEMVGLNTKKDYLKIIKLK